VFNNYRESKLTRILDQCPDAPWHQQVLDYLHSVREERAKHLLEIANYFYGLYTDGKSHSLRCVESYLRDIVEKYPEYSHMDSVLLTLGDVQTEQNEFDEAWSVYLKITNEFPASRLVPTAYGRIRKLQEKALAQPYQ
jgi:outer membrane protein assembly factor BamD (BamD/ComL family)